MADEEKAADDHHYPLDKKCYKLVEVIGRGVRSVVHKAICIPMGSSDVVAIKVIHLQKSNADFIEDLRREARYSSLLNHPTLLRPHCFFTVDDDDDDDDDTSIWVVMPFMSGGSLQSIAASSAYPDGLPEPCIAAVLKEILATLAHIHGELHFHGSIKASNILVDSINGLKLADSSMSSYTMSGTGYWMAPEVIPSHTGYDEKTDIWSFGITALELAHGKPPISHPADHLPCSMNIVSKFTECFKHMVGVCLDHDPSKRPTAKTLLKHPFFQKCVVGPLFLIKNVPAADLAVAGEEEGGEILRGWKFNEERFELDAVYGDDVMVHHQEEGSSSSSSCDDDRALVLKEMEMMMESLENRKQKVQQFIVNLRGEMTAEEMMQEIVNLEMEKENRGIKWFEMEMERERLQQRRRRRR